MVTKTIRLDFEAYDLLKKLKAPGESFSDVVKRIASNRRPLSSYAGIWKAMSQYDLRKVARAIERGRQLDYDRAALVWSMSARAFVSTQVRPRPRTVGKL